MEAEGGEILVFEVEGRRFGLDASSVEELVRAVAITALPPGTSPDLEGVVNVRGRIVPVLDLRRRLGLPARDVELSDHMIVARAGGRTVVIRVDRALDLVRIESDEGRPAPAIEGGSAAVARLADGLAPILDLDRWAPPDRPEQAPTPALATREPRP